MHARLEFILGRITICAETKNWLVLATWDGVLQWCACAARCMLASIKLLIFLAGCSCVIPCLFVFVPSSCDCTMSFAFFPASSRGWFAAGPTCSLGCSQASRIRVGNSSQKTCSFLGSRCGGFCRRNSGPRLDCRIHRKQLSAKSTKVLTDTVSGAML